MADQPEGHVIKTGAESVEERVKILQVPKYHGF
jgi:hypothetical protein